MSIRAQLERKAKSKEQEIIELEAKIRECRAFLLGLQEALKVLPRDGVQERTSDKVLRPGSDMAKVRDILRKYPGKALHVTEILKEMGKEINKTNRISIGGSLSFYCRKGEIFKKTAPNTFSLKENGEDLPDNFGMGDVDEES